MNITDKIDTFDACAHWISPGESFTFEDVPDVTLRAFDITPTMGVVFEVLRRTDTHSQHIVNRVSFQAFPGMIVLHAIAHAYQ